MEGDSRRLVGVSKKQSGLLKECNSQENNDTAINCARKIISYEVFL